MANVLPEVRPLVESMPHEGFVMQTGGSARRSFIKNNGFDHYFVHGVPGHTHNSSAMLSVTADYSERRGVAEDISAGVWAEEKVDLGVNDFTDSVEPDDAAQLYDRAIERGIGTITLIPENCQHIIKEPARSISEVRTIVSGKDRLDTLTYVNNEYGWVDPVSGNLGSAFNRTVPVQVNFFGYPAPLGDVHGISVPNVQVVNAPTIRQPVYIGSRNNDKWRYAITSKGASAPGVVPDWDGNVPFLWDDDTHTYRSKKFSKWFGAALVQTEAGCDGGDRDRAPRRDDVQHPVHSRRVRADWYNADRRKHNPRARDRRVQAGQAPGARGARRARADPAGPVQGHVPGLLHVSGAGRLLCALPRAQRDGLLQRP